MSYCCLDKAGSIAVLIAVSLRAQTINPQAILDSLRLQVESTVQRAPRYTCMESIERYWYANRKPNRPGCDTDRPPEAIARNLVRSDRLRLDVAVVCGQEMFSWHGQNTFQTDEIDRLVTSGPVSSGTYSSFLSGIFLDGIAKVDYRGLRSQDGRQMAVFGYAVPIGVSKFQTRTDSGTEVMGYHGEFSADSSTGQLGSLQILTDDMPESAWVCSFNSEVRYGVLTLNGIAFQLPSSVDMDILHFNSEHSRTVTHYGDCHEFHGESVLRFDNAPAAAAASAVKPGPRLAPGLQVQIKIISSINPQTAWAGDPIDGKLAADLVDKGGRVIAPEGTPVGGRLLRLETWAKPYRSYTVVLQFLHLSAAGEDYTLNLKSTTAPSRDGPSSSLRQRTYLNNPPISEDGGACRFRLSEKDVNLKNVVTYWLTE